MPYAIDDLFQDPYIPQEKPQDLVSTFILSKVNLQTAIVDSLQNRIRERERLKWQRIKDLNEIICSCRTILLNRFNFRYSLIDTSHRDNLEITVSSLEREVAAQPIERWKDIVQVERDLIGEVKELFRTLRLLKALYP